MTGLASFDLGESARTQVNQATQLTESAARDLVESMKQTVGILERQVLRAFHGRAWLPLGYTTWNELCESEFTDGRVRLPRETRQELHATLASEGMSTRAIAAVTGADRGTVMNDIAQVVGNQPPAQDLVTGDADDREALDVDRDVASSPVASTPDDEIVEAVIVERPRTIGLDGKTYTKPAPKQLTPEEQARRAAEQARLDALNASCTTFFKFVSQYGDGFNADEFRALYDESYAPSLTAADIDGALETLTQIAKQWRN